jgi:hypothetical protein
LKGEQGMKHRRKHKPSQGVQIGTIVILGGGVLLVVKALALGTTVVTVIAVLFLISGAVLIKH